MTLNEITTVLAERLERPFDTPLKLILAERVKVWRSRLIRNSIDKDERERQYFKQTLFVPLQAGTEVICNVPFTQCAIAISKCKIPVPLRGNNIYYDYVGNITGTKPFKKFVTGTLEYLMHGKYSKKTIWFKVENDLLKVWGNPELPMAMIEGIFDNPEEVANLNCTCGQTAQCDFWNQPYPVSGDILQMILQAIIDSDYGRSRGTESEQIPVAQPITTKP